MYDINELFLFRGLDPEERGDAIASLDGYVAFSKGEVIYNSGDFRRAVGVFLCGRGAACEGKTVKANFAEGGVFGAAALFGADKNYESTVVALSDCLVIFISEQTLRAIMEKYPVCAVNYITFLSEKVRYLNRKIAQYTGNGAASRLYRLLRFATDENGVVSDVNMSSLAKQSGMGRTSVYRALAELEKSGTIIKENKVIKVK